VSARDGHTIQVAHESPYNNPNPAFAAVIGAVHHPLSGGVACAHEEDLVRL